MRLLLRGFSDGPSIGAFECLLVLVSSIDPQI